MPWEDSGDNVSFSGPMADLMGVIMAAFEIDYGNATDGPTPGEYVTATAVVLREVLLENFEDEPEGEAKEFVQRISDAMTEDEDGVVHIATFELLDDIAESIDEAALSHWLGSVPVRNAIQELAQTAFS